ncbi:MAG TPA: hypothetical protein PKJ51_00090 [Methanothrix sp.]|nr:hypothetical protein [Methanothrix sp.]
MIIGTDPIETPFDLGAAVVRSSSWQMDARAVACPRVQYQIDLLVRGQYRKFYQMSARIGLPTPTYSMDAVIVHDAADPRLTESLINCFFWAYANQHDQADQAIQSVVHRLKLDYAASEDLDDHWGRILGLRRRGGETDETYRTRLATYIRKITSYGTAANVQMVVDRVVGISGASTLETLAPATVRLGWSDTEIAKIAATKTDQIGDAMDEAIAAGVTWSTSYPYAEYQMDWGRWLPVSVSYTASTAIARRRGYVYLAATGLWKSRSATYRADSLVYVPRSVTYRADGQVVADHSSAYIADTILTELIAATGTATYDGGAYVSKPYRRFYSMSVVIEE